MRFMGLLAVAALLIAAGARADTPISDEAKQHFGAGVAFLEDPDGERVEEAYAAFKRAYALSKSPKILGNLGYCAMKLERDGEAIDAYGTYLAEVHDIDPGERAQIEKDLAALRATTATLEITTDLPEATLVDVRIPVKGPSVNNVYSVTGGKLTVRIRPGHHELRLKSGGSEKGVWDLDALAGGRAEHAFVTKTAPPEAPKPPPAPPSPPPPAEARSWAPIIITGVGGLLLASAAVAGGVALGKERDLEDRCAGGCPRGSDWQHDVTSGKRWAVAGDVLLLGGAVVTGIGVGWLLFGSSSKSPTTGLVVSPTAHGVAGTWTLRF